MASLGTMASTSINKSFSLKELVESEVWKESHTPGTIGVWL